MTDMLVKINIRSPTSTDDQTLHCDLEHRVLDLKVQIQTKWPSHPRPKDQRLVYAGKLLEDDAILKNVLRLDDARDENDAFTVHLVCRMTSPPPVVVASTSTSKESSVNNSNEASNVEANHLRQRTVNSQNINPVSAQNIPNPWEMMYSQSQNQHQATMMQQMYTNYMTQYIQYLQSVGAMYQMPSATQDVVDHPNQITDEARAAGVGAEAPQAQVFNHVAAAAMAGAMAHGGAGLPQQEQPLQPQQPAAAAVAEVNPEVNRDVAAAVADAPVGDNNNFIMNAGAGGIGAMEDEDDMNGGQRDVLDWCYVATRVLVLFSVVYFYSSLARFALAAGLGIIFYLYNNGFFGQREQPRAEAEAVNEVRQVAGAAGDANPQQRVDQGQEGNNDGGGDENPDQQQQPNNNEAATEVVAAAIAEDQRPHFLNVMATFVTTFFTSLLPNDQPIL